MLNSEKADLILYNGKIAAFDKKNTICEALASRLGRIIQIGKLDEIWKLLGSDTVVIDLGGRFVTPGLVDCHIHTVDYGFSNLILDLRYPEVKNINDIVQLVKKEAERLPKGSWIRGVGWDEALLEDKRAPTRFDLDPVSPEHPVVLDAQIPYEVVNTFALKKIGVEPTPDISGLLSSGEQSRRIKDLSRDYKVEECEQAIIKAQQRLFEVGVTAQKDAGCTDIAIQAYRNLHERRELKIRSSLMIGIHNGRTSVELAKEAVNKFKPGGDDILAITGIKCSFDGSGGNRTAWLYEEWNKNYTDSDTGNFGGPIISEPQSYPEIAKIIHNAGFQIGAHCVGDHTIDLYLDAVEAAIRDEAKRDCRHSIIHCNLPTDYAFRKMKILGNNIIVEATSAYLYFIGDLYAGNFGPTRSRRLIPIRTLIERGVNVGNGCDWNTCLVNPMYGIYAACTRRPRKGVYDNQPFGTDECITRLQALLSYTINSAYCMFWEDKIGSLEVGKYTDLVVWPDNPMTIPDERLLDLKPIMTIVNGEIVYDLYNKGDNN